MLRLLNCFNVVLRLCAVGVCCGCAVLGCVVGVCCSGVL